MQMRGTLQPMAARMVCHFVWPSSELLAKVSSQVHGVRGFIHFCGVLLTYA